MNFSVEFFSEYFNSIKGIKDSKANGFRELVFKDDIVGSPFIYQNKLFNALYYKVPKDKYFVIGDNLNMSNDSRNFGPIEFKDIIGKVVFSVNFYI